MIESQPASVPVKSTAVVKYSAVQTPANFARLRCNTNLNLPPSNWLRNSVDSYGLQHVLSHSTGFSSFRMAHMFPDCVGEVDVVSDAENIKTLLKLPYSQGPVSMMVHRIENTLLIDDFDIYKHLLRTAETEWDWLKKFFYDHIKNAFSNKNRVLCCKGKKRNALQQKSLMSKFLYHSLIESSEQYERKTQEQDEFVAPSLSVSGPALPEPSLEEEVPDPTTDHKYNRNVVWTFEDIQMLIGTDMPIFGGSTHPCISLRLRNMNKPISVLTGIDYWLDNLMSNVPEVVMCYHLNGIVQKYEFVKTEDLPYLEDSKFSPKLIRDIAQNILSFLKTNATKAGHTYWLFKGKNDDVVKLYDLTSLCSGVLDEKGQNPFTVPVAMLLYRVARNMKHSIESTNQSGTIKMLLKNCIELLNKEKYPQIVTSSHYMLSDLYIPAHTNPNNPQFEADVCKSDNNYDDDIEESSVQGNETEANVKELRLSEMNDRDNDTFKYKAPPAISGTITERCVLALSHVVAGLKCLKYFSLPDQNSEEATKEQQQKSCEAENLKMAHPYEPIPMGYSSLSNNEENKSKKSKRKNKSDNKKSKKSSNLECDDKSPKLLLPKPKAEAMPTWQEPDRRDDASWNVHLKTLLYEKACLIYAILAEQEFLLENYGNSLRYISLLYKSHKVLKSLQFSSQHVDESCLLGRAGDCCCMIEKHWSKVHEYQNQYSISSEVDNEMMEEIEKEYPTEDDVDDWITLLPDNIKDNEQMLDLSLQFYKHALKHEPVNERINLLRRVGNVHNELGSYYMHRSQSNIDDASVLQSCINNSFYHLSEGIRSFESIDDKVNSALVHMNMGRLMRLCAHFSARNLNEPMLSVNQEKVYHIKALDNYKQARNLLVNRETNPGIWDAVTWELSTTSYNMVTTMQDYPESGKQTQKELEHELTQMLQKSLEYCDMDTPSLRQPMYQYRGANIHHRLASLYHSIYRRMSPSDARRKATLGLIKIHYERAAEIFFSLEVPSEYLTVQLEYIVLFLQQFQNVTALQSKEKNLLTALKVLIDAAPMLKLMYEQNVKQTKILLEDDKSTEAKSNETKNYTEDLSESTKEENSNEESDMKMLDIFEHQLQHILLNLAKLFSKPNKIITSDQSVKYGNLYKKLYSLTLKIGVRNSIEGYTLAKHLFDILTVIKENIKEIKQPVLSSK